MSRERVDENVRKEAFFSTENFDIIHHVLENTVGDTGAVDDETDNVIRNRIFEAMYAEFRTNQDRPLVDLNKGVIRKVLQAQNAPDVSSNVGMQGMDTMNTNTNGIRDLETKHIAQPLHVNERPVQSRVVDDDAMPDNMRVNVNERFEDFQKERDMIYKREVPEKVNFEIDGGENNDDIMRKFSEMTRQRDSAEAATEENRKKEQTALLDTDARLIGEEDAPAEEASRGGDLRAAMVEFEARRRVLESAVEEEQRAGALRDEEREDAFQRSLREMVRPTEEATDAAVPEDFGEQRPHHQAPDSAGGVNADRGAQPFPSGHAMDEAPLQLRAELDGNSGAGLARMAEDARLVASADYPTTEQVGQLFTNAREQTALQEHLRQQSARAADDTLIKRVTEFASKTYYLEVSSNDRPFNVADMQKRNRFNFDVSFSAANLEPLLLPRFNDTPWLTTTEEEASCGYRGDPDPNFQANSTTFDYNDRIVGFDEICRPSRRIAGPNINRTLRNVEDVVVTRVHFFSTKETTATGTMQKFFREHPLQYPYLLLHVDELGSQYESSDSELGKSFCRLYIDKTWKHVDNTGDHYVFIPPNTEKMVFRTPIASLSRLTFRLTTPDGMPLSSATDSARLLQVVLRTTNNDLCAIKIDLKLRDFVPKQSFQEGHTLMLRDIEWYHQNRYTEALNVWTAASTPGEQFQYPFDLGVDESGNADNRFSQFREFLHRDEGHFIVETSRDDAVLQTDCHRDEFVNTITIAYPYDADYVTGKTDPRDFGFRHALSSEILGTDPDHFNQVLKDARTINGVAYNRTIQTLVSLTVNCREEVTGIAVENV